MLFCDSFSSVLAASLNHADPKTEFITVKVKILGYLVRYELIPRKK